MKTSILVVPFFYLLVCVMLSFGFKDRTKEKAGLPNNAGGFVVVELFTAEGCSSCPPADDAVSSLLKEYPDRVFVLGFHVDYWNYLGWKDAFSMASFSERQRRYADVFGLNSIYTPQIVVNGIIQFTGSDKNRLHKTVEASLNNAAASNIEIEAKSSDQKNVIVHYKSHAGENSLVNIALIQLHAVSAVQSGENKGRHLTHANIVRAFVSPGTNSGELRFVIPGGLLPADCNVIAFVQDKKMGFVTGAVQTRIH